MDGEANDGHMDTHMGFLGSPEPARDDFISGMILSQLGSVGRSYKRESRRTFKHLVSEIYSPPRVTKLLKESRYKYLMPGLALDLTVVDPDDGSQVQAGEGPGAIPPAEAVPAHRLAGVQAFLDVVRAQPVATRECGGAEARESPRRQAH